MRIMEQQRDFSDCRKITKEYDENKKNNWRKKVTLKSPLGDLGADMGDFSLLRNFHLQIPLKNLCRRVCIMEHRKKFFKLLKGYTGT